jgi:hypothetical protein
MKGEKCRRCDGFGDVESGPCPECEGRGTSIRWVIEVHQHDRPDKPVTFVTSGAKVQVWRNPHDAIETLLAMQLDQTDYKLAPLRGVWLPTEIAEVPTLSCVPGTLKGDRLARLAAPGRFDCDLCMDTGLVGRGSPPEILACPSCSRHATHDVTFGKGGPGGRCSTCHTDLTTAEGTAVRWSSEKRL